MRSHRIPITQHSSTPLHDAMLRCSRNSQPIPTSRHATSALGRPTIRQTHRPTGDRQTHKPASLNGQRQSADLLGTLLERVRVVVVLLDQRHDAALLPAERAANVLLAGDVDVRDRLVLADGRQVAHDVLRSDVTGKHHDPAEIMCG